MLQKPPLLGSTETKSLVKKITSEGIENRIAERYPRSFDQWEEEARTVIDTLAQCGIHSPTDYCNFGLKENERGDNADQICARIFKAKKFREDRFSFFNLGRIHQALEHERSVRNDEIEKLRIPIPTEEDLHRQKIEARDIGSRVPYRNDKHFLEERLKNRKFRKIIHPEKQKTKFPISS